jgi:pyrimidine-nucleoside phosphorylase
MDLSDRASGKLRYRQLNSSISIIRHTEVIMAEKSIVEIIEKKRDGLELSQQEIESFVAGSHNGSWRDYQLSAMLMAIYLKGLSAEETAALTLAMAASGEQFDLSALRGIKVDKHSTGGVADTATLIAAPLAAACGVPVFKVSGRGLGFTGGTIDKLDSIPGFQTSISKEQAIAQAGRIGLAIMSQTDQITPADRKLYALRDVTATIDHIPLIAASIMSKKIAAGADAVMLDVKCGSGAFMRTAGEARQLAETMVSIGKLVGLRVKALISSMDQPLGNLIGNSLEVIDAIEVLKGRTGGDLLEVSMELAAGMTVLGGIAQDNKQAEGMLQAALQSGKGLEKLEQLITAQGGNPKVIDDYSLFAPAKVSVQLRSSRSGYLTRINAALIGKGFVAAGGGRYSKEDSIDPAAGIIMSKRLQDRIDAGDLIAEIRASSLVQAEKARNMVEQALTFSKKPLSAAPVILERID